MKILFYSSVNIDYTYRVDHIVREGETLSSDCLTIGAGGKGANQCAAFAKAVAPGCDCKVFLAGKCGKDGQFILDKLNNLGVDTSYMVQSEIPTGNAIIQLDKNGRNSIVLFGGGNRAVEKSEIDRVFENFSSQDVLCINCEINNLDYIIDMAHAKGMRIVLNPSPVNDVLDTVDLTKVSCIILNEVEGQSLTGKTEFQQILEDLSSKFSFSEIVLTVGDRGAYCKTAEKTYFVPCNKVEVVDTTGAGDTFMGYYFCSRLNNCDIERSLQIASAAASIAVSRPGAMDSIPFFAEI